MKNVSKLPKKPPSVVLMRCAGVEVEADVAVVWVAVGLEEAVWEVVGAVEVAVGLEADVAVVWVGAVEVVWDVVGAVADMVGGVTVGVGDVVVLVAGVEAGVGVQLGKTGRFGAPATTWTTLLKLDHLVVEPNVSTTV